MATLYYAGWEDAKEVALGDPVYENVVNIAGSSTQSVALTGGNTSLRKRVRLFADADCFVTWGANPTATSDGTSGRPLGAENPEYFDIADGYLLAVIERS